MQSAREPRYVIRFGMFEVELRSGELRKNGVKVKIQDLPFRALTLLLSHPHEVVSRDQFRQALWPDGVFVDFDHGISSACEMLWETPPTIPSSLRRSNGVVTAGSLPLAFQNHPLNRAWWLWNRNRKLKPT